MSICREGQVGGMRDGHFADARCEKAPGTGSADDGSPWVSLLTGFLMHRRNFEKLVKRQWRKIPDSFREKVSNLSLQVEDWADKETLASVGFGSPEDLLGLYRGWPLPERGNDYGSCLPDVITLYQGAIEEEARSSGNPVGQVIRETLVHELAHYFGFSEEEMDTFEAIWRGEDRQP